MNWLLLQSGQEVGDGSVEGVEQSFPEISVRIDANSEGVWTTLAQTVFKVVKVVSKVD